jgi:hypothetical protein
MVSHISQEVGWTLIQIDNDRYPDNGTNIHARRQYIRRDEQFLASELNLLPCHERISSNGLDLAWLGTNRHKPS